MKIHLPYFCIEDNINLTQEVYQLIGLWYYMDIVLGGVI